MTNIPVTEILRPKTDVGPVTWDRCELVPPVCGVPLARNVAAARLPMSECTDDMFPFYKDNRGSAYKTVEKGNRVLTDRNGKEIMLTNFQVRLVLGLSALISSYRVADVSISSYLEKMRQDGFVPQNWNGGIDFFIDFQKFANFILRRRANQRERFMVTKALLELAEIDHVQQIEKGKYYMVSPLLSFAGGMMTAVKQEGAEERISKETKEDVERRQIMAEELQHTLEVLKTELDGIGDLTKVQWTEDVQSKLSTITKMGKQIAILRNCGELEGAWMRVSSLFFWRLDERYAFISPKIFNIWGKAGTRTEVFGIMLMQLLSVFGGKHVAADKELSKARKALKGRQEIGTEDRENIIDQAMTYTEGEESILSRVSRDFGGARQTSSFRKQIAQAAEAYLEIGLVKKWQEEEGKKGRMFKFVLNYDYNSSANIELLTNK